MNDDPDREAMLMALLEVADIELRGCESMNPVIALGKKAGGRLTAYAHLRLRPGARGLFPFDVAPAQRAFYHDEVDLFGLCYGVWPGPGGTLLGQPEGFPGRQTGVVTVLGRRGQVTASVYPILWNEAGFGGFGLPKPLAAPVGDLLAEHDDDVVVPLPLRKTTPT